MLKQDLSQAERSPIRLKLMIVGNIKLNDLKQEWDLVFVDTLSDCIQEIEYGNSYHGIIIDIQHTNLRNSDGKIFMRRMDEMQCREQIIGITDDFFAIDALKEEIGISILMKPFDLNSVKNILEIPIFD